MSNQNQVIELIHDSFKALREDMTHRLERIETKLDDVVTDNDCKNNRINCINETSIKKSELSIKRITIIGGVITGTITACTTLILTVLKMFYPEL